MGHFSEYYLTYTAEDAARDKADGLPVLVFPKAPADRLRGTPNQERAAEKLTDVRRGRGADGGVWILGNAFCKTCGRETSHRAFDNAPFPICQEHGDEDW